MCRSGTGDDGNTSRLGTDQRISKDTVIIEAVGALDEAMAFIGNARVLVRSERVKQILLQVQRKLIDISAHVSAASDQRGRYPGASHEDVDHLEQWIIKCDANLPKLTEFVIPGENQRETVCHIARTVVRRAERRVITAAQAEPSISTSNTAYLNRLSTLLFAVARIETQDQDSFNA